MSNFEPIYAPNEGNIPKDMAERSVIVRFRDGTGGRYPANELCWRITGSDTDIVGWFPGSENGPISCADRPAVDAVTQFVVAQKLGYPAGVAVKALVDHANNGGKDRAIRAAIKACRDILWIEYGVTE